MKKFILLYLSFLNLWNFKIVVTQSKIKTIYFYNNAIFVDIYKVC